MKQPKKAGSFFIGGTTVAVAFAWAFDSQAIVYLILIVLLGFWSVLLALENK